MWSFSQIWCRNTSKVNNLLHAYDIIKFLKHKKDVDDKRFAIAASDHYSFQNNFSYIYYQCWKNVLVGYICVLSFYFTSIIRKQNIYYPDTMLSIIHKIVFHQFSNYYHFLGMHFIFVQYRWNWWKTFIEVYGCKYVGFSWTQS